MSTIEELLAPFVGKAETDAIEIKRAPPHTRSLVEKIQGAINADIPECLFLIGVDEIDGKVDPRGIVGVDYPLSAEGSNGSFATFDKYRLHLLNTLQANTIPWQAGLVDISEVHSADGAKSAIAVRVGGGILVQSKKGHCPIREGTSVRPMMLDEIAAKQAGRAPSVTTSLPWEGAREDYFATLPRDQKTGRFIGFFFTAAPVGAPLDLAAPWEGENESLAHKAHVYTARLGADDLALDAMEGANYSGPLQRQPMQNGVYARWYRTIPPFRGNNSVAAEDVSMVHLRRDGSITLSTRSTYLDPAPHLNIRWVLADAVNTLSLIERARLHSEQMDAPYAVGLELRYDEQLADDVHPVSMGEWLFCELADEQGRIGKVLPSKPLQLGPYEVHGHDQFPLLMRRIYEDLEIAAGRQPKKDLSFEGTFTDPYWFPT